MRISKKKLSIAMATSGFSFIDLSKESGVSRTTLSYINNGKSCRPDVAGKIARALSMPVEQLIEQEAP